MIEFLNIDCMAYMATLPDKAFDLAVVDPEYGINAALKKSYHASALTNYKPKKWDNKIPDEKYFHELFRVSENQIVWGGNYFTDYLPPSAKWIIWDKKQPEGIDQAMMEMAWQSQQNKQSKIYRQSAQSNCNKVANNRELAKKYIRIHPTQKPVALYKWLLHNYAKPGDRILDTHGGSMSSAIAAEHMGFDMTICELDKDYFDAGVKRFKEQTMQIKIF